MTRSPSLFTAVDELALVIGPELAADFIAHRKMLKKPMTPKAGQLMADRLRKMPNPIASVEQSIRNGWQDCFEVREERRQQSYGAARGLDHFARAIQDEESTNGSHGQVGSHAIDFNDVGGVPRLSGYRH